MPKMSGLFYNSIYKKSGKIRNIDKCLEKEFIQILIINSALESSGLKIYDLFNMIHHNKVKVPLCYKNLAGIYVFLERSLGDPHLSLRKLSEVLQNKRISSFLREYANVLISTGDTRSYVDSVLREEMIRIRTRISETLKFVDLLYESILILTIGFSLILIMPFINIPLYITQFSIVMIGLIGYMIASSILSNIDIAIPKFIMMIDTIYIISSCILIVNNYGILVHGLLILPLYLIIKRKSLNVFRLENAGLALLRSIYSSITLNMPIDKAISTSLERQPFREFKLINHYFKMGLNIEEIVYRLELPNLVKKIFYLITTPMLYSNWRGHYIFSVIRIFDHLIDIRKYIVEKARSYVLYSIILTALIFISYVLISRSDLMISSETMDMLYVHGYLGFLSMYIPASLLKDRGFTSSSTSVFLIPLISCITYLLLKCL
ncbi:MAG: hypothetical protein QW708_02385 [Desulfurococcaceae archaeon]